LEAHTATVQPDGLQPESTGDLALVAPRRAFAGARRDALNRRLLAVSDAAAAGLALLMSVLVASGPSLHLAALLVMPIAVLASKVIGLYDRDDVVISKSTIDEVPAILQLATLYTLIIWLLDGPLLNNVGRMNHWQMAGMWSAFFVLSVFGRALVRRVVLAISPAERCLIVGDETSQLRVGAQLAQHVAKVEVVGRLDASITEEDNAQCLGRLIVELAVDRIILVPDHAQPDAMLTMIRAAKGLGVRISILPRVLEVVGSSVVLDDLGGMPLLGVRPFGLSNSSRLVKRAFDLVGATVTLILASPVMIAVAVAIKLDSPGPVFFRQVRVGRDGHPFRILKFRSMITDAEDHKAALHSVNEADGLFKIAADPRTTRVGRWLRRTSVDELPQLFNVLRGEMSLVGPRPLIASEDEKITGFDRRRLNLTPGMTGHWQILGSARVPLNEMVKIDYLYVAGWSLWSDIKLLVRTVPFVIARRGL